MKWLAWGAIAVGTALAQPAPPANLVAWEARKAAYLEHAARADGLQGTLARLAAGGPLGDPAPILAHAEQVARREDKSEFSAVWLLRLLELHPGALPPPLAARVEDALLGYRYWLDEPGRDAMHLWTENHVLGFAAAEYLAGQRWPQRVFPTSGLSGREHEAKGRARFLRWARERVRYGFSEWFSPVYSGFHLAPLVALCDHARDPEVRRRAAAVLDLLLFDLARLPQRGNFGLSAGRTYAEYCVDPGRHGVADAIELLQGSRGGFRPGAQSGAVALASARRYRLPWALAAIAVDRPPATVERLRVGLRPDEAAAEGIGFERLADGVFWWQNGAYLDPRVLPLSRRMVRELGLGHRAEFALLGQLPAEPRALATLGRALGRLTQGPQLTGVELVVFHAPEVLLSSAQDHHPGAIGFQQHPWQATFDLEAVVFTSAPGLWNRPGPSDWGGNASLPRVIQVRDVLVALYSPSLTQRALFPRRTHAYVPRAAFDEVREAGRWTFARKGAGYLALYSARPTRWQTEGDYTDRELIADGPRNAWVCQVGSRAEDGPFERFVARVSQATIRARGTNRLGLGPLELSYAAPDVGTLRVPWAGAPTLDGRPLPAPRHPRFDTRYAQVPWLSSRVEIRHAGYTLRLDGDTALREGDGL